MKVNWFILAVVVLQVFGSFYSLFKQKDLFTFIVYILYALANVAFALGPELINKVFK